MLLTEFDFESSPLQFYQAPNGEPVVTASSMIKALKGDSMNAASITRNNVRSKWIIEIPTPSGGRPTLCLFEPGAYQLATNPMFQTELAERFQDFLFEEILPKLRRGEFAIVSSPEQALPIALPGMSQSDKHHLLLREGKLCAEGVKGLVSARRNSRHN